MGRSGSGITAQRIVADLKQLGNQSIAAHSGRFFKTGPGEYGEGDQFLGIRVPVLRGRVRKWRDAPLSAITELLKSPWHEARLFALFLMVERFKGGNMTDREKIYDLYLERTGFINNWDLVDSSAHLIVGPFLQDRDRSVLFKLVRSDSLWERRIAVMATFHFIRAGSFSDTLELAQLLLDDRHDLIHKAVGWMLREIGKRDIGVEKRFLNKHYKRMPRTMLRYAIEKFDQSERQAYLRGTV